MSRNLLYPVLAISCILGYSWIYLNSAGSINFGGCLIKHLTNIPCPSCGSTRSVISIFQGNYLNALYLNPFGYLVAIIMIILPAWIAFDLFFGMNSVFVAYQKVEQILERRKVAIPTTMVVLLNWYWNFYKGL